MNTAAAIDYAADVIRRTAPDELPLAGKVWTATILDDEIVLRIQASKVNGTPVPRQPPKPPPPPPKEQPKPPGKGR